MSIAIHLTIIYNISGSKSKKLRLTQGEKVPSFSFWDLGPGKAPFRREKVENFTLKPYTLDNYTYHMESDKGH